jgi:hypothetical protein
MAAGVAVSATGCAAGRTSAPTKHAGPAASKVLPVSFTVAARYTAKSLGLNHPDALAIGLDGKLYVTDLSQRDVERLSLRRFHVHPLPPGQPPS